MLMPGRSYSGTGAYRYGFNGKEKDPEVKGMGAQYDYGFRIYDPRLGRFLSVDPLTQSYPWYTPYQFAGNMPIWAIDLDGLEEMKGNSVAHVIRDVKGNIISKPTKVRGSGYIAYLTGVRKIDDSSVEVTPGISEIRPGGFEYFNTFIWQQISGDNYTVMQTNTAIGKSIPGNKPMDSNLLQGSDNDEYEPPTTNKPKLESPSPKIAWRTGTNITISPIVIQYPMYSSLDVEFELNSELRGTLGNEFKNSHKAASSISSYSARLKANGITRIEVSITAKFRSFSDQPYKYKSVNELIQNRGLLVIDEFRKHGIEVVGIQPSLGDPSVTANATKSIQRIIGWNVRKIPIKQKLIDGKPSGEIQKNGEEVRERIMGNQEPQKGVIWNK
jgi:RHS repeat-associated protein